MCEDIFRTSADARLVLLVDPLDGAARCGQDLSCFMVLLGYPCTAYFAGLAVPSLYPSVKLQRSWNGLSMMRHRADVKWCPARIHRSACRGSQEFPPRQ
jgi:hypothetical protein